MPQVVRVEGGQADEVISASQLRPGEFAILVQMAEEHSGARPGDPLVKTFAASGTHTYQFLHPSRIIWSSSNSGGDGHKVRRLRPGEKLIIENTGS